MSNKKLEEEENVHSWEDIVGEDCWGYGNLDYGEEGKKKSVFIVKSDDYDPEDSTTYTKTPIKFLYLPTQLEYTKQFVVNIFFQKLSLNFNINTQTR